MKKSRVRVFLLHRRLLAVLCTLAVAAGIFYVTLYPASQAAAASTRQLPIYSVERKEKLCSISFDAAWGDVKVRQFSCLTAALCCDVRDVRYKSESKKMTVLRHLGNRFLIKYVQFTYIPRFPRFVPPAVVDDRRLPPHVLQRHAVPVVPVKGK